MRVGTNPEKNNPKVRLLFQHRIIIPVYIPNLEGYFEHLLEIVELSLKSLCLSAGDKAYITVVLNGCCSDVIKKTQEWFDEGIFNQLIINQENLGKVDGTLSIAKGATEEFVTISDCDVLFKPGWLEEVEHIFTVFPEAGFVSPTPAPHLAWSHTSAMMLDAFLKRELWMGQFISEEDMQKFSESVGTPNFINEKQLVIRRRNAIACAGAGHFVFSVRKAVVEGMPSSAAGTTLSSDSDKNWFDVPPDRMGYWRLSAMRSFAYHLGNVPERWMYEELESYRQSPSTTLLSPLVTPHPSRRNFLRFIPLVIRQHLVSLIRRTFLFNIFVRLEHRT